MIGPFGRAAQSFAGEFVLGLAVWGCLHLLVPPSDERALSRVFHEAGVIFLSLLVPVVIRISRNRNLVASLLELSHNIGGRRRGPLLRMLDQGLLEVRDRLDALQRHPGAQLNEPSQLLALYKSCFEMARGPYLGIDTNPPSRYMKKYSPYLQAHAGALRARSARILAVSRDALRVDLASQPGIFKEFYDWHIANGILLLQADPEEANGFAENAGMTSRDLALWPGDYAVVFDPSTSPERVRFLDGPDSTYRAATRYMKLVLGKAVLIRLEGETLGFITRDAKDVKDMVEDLS